MEYLAERWKHQIIGEERAFDNFLQRREGFGFFFEPGTGKTHTTINTIRRIFNSEKRFLRTLIVCPSVVCSNWKDEFKKFSKVEQRKICVLNGQGKKRLETFEKRAFDDFKEKVPQIFITNYESFGVKSSRFLNGLYYKVLEWQPELLVLDESHKIKEINASRTKRIERIANPVDKKIAHAPVKPLVYLLTGTPVLNTPMDLFSQLLMLDGGQSLGENFYVFRARYFYDKNANMPQGRHFPDYRPKPGALEEIQSILSKKCMLAKKDDCLDLPPLLKQKIYVEMTEEQSVKYHEMKHDLITFIENEACTASMALTKALRLMQIASGFLKTEDAGIIALSENPKINALKELLEDYASSQKIIVWAVFKYDYEKIKELCKKLKIEFVTLHGGMTDNSRNTAIDAFNKDEKVRVLIGHPKSGGIGVNLTASNLSIYYSRNFSLEDRIQSEARNYRGGSEIHKSVTHIDLVLKNSIEEKVIEVLDNKTEIGLSILKNLVV